LIDISCQNQLLEASFFSVHWIVVSCFDILNLNVVNISENKLWFQPECTGSGSDGQVGPSPRAFHVAVAIDCHMFIFGGRSGGRRHANAM